MHLLPLNLAPISNLCSKGDARFGGTSGVQLRVAQDNTFVASATDGRRAIIVSGDCSDASEYPEIPALSASPNGECESIIPAKEWTKVFRDATKLVGKCFKPILQSVPVVIGKDCTSFGATNLESILFAQPRNVDGSFPNVPQVIPSSDAAFACVRVDPKLLADALKVVSDLNASEEDFGIDLELHGNARQVRIIAIRSRRTLHIDAAVVPLCIKIGEGKQKEDVTDSRAIPCDAGQEPVNQAEIMAAKIQVLENALQHRRELCDKLQEQFDSSDAGQQVKLNQLLRENFDAMHARAIKAESALNDRQEYIGNATSQKLQDAIAAAEDADSNCREATSERDTARREAEMWEKKYDALDVEHDELGDKLDAMKKQYADYDAIVADLQSREDADDYASLANHREYVKAMAK